MKVYADENIERTIIEGLRRRGIDIISAVEIGYKGKSDLFHIKKANEMKAVILTHDVDFLRIVDTMKIKHRGIIFAHSKDLSIGECIRGVELIVNVLDEREMENHIEFL